MTIAWTNTERIDVSLLNNSILLQTRVSHVLLKHSARHRSRFYNRLDLNLNRQHRLRMPMAGEGGGCQCRPSIVGRLFGVLLHGSLLRRRPPSLSLPQLCLVPNPHPLLLQLLLLPVRPFPPPQQGRPFPLGPAAPCLTLDPPSFPPLHTVLLCIHILLSDPVLIRQTTVKHRGERAHLPRIRETLRLCWSE